jgi:hypothetical protein
LRKSFPKNYFFCFLPEAKIWFAERGFGTSCSVYFLHPAPDAGMSGISKSVQVRGAHQEVQICIRIGPIENGIVFPCA